MTQAGAICSACHARPATRIFTAPVRQDGPIQDAQVCADCYSVLVVTPSREVLQGAAEVVARHGKG